MNDRRPFPDPNPQIFAVNDRVRTMCPGFRHGQAGRITEVIPSVRPCDYSYSITLDDGLKVRTAGEWLQADASPADTSPPDPAKPADSPAGPVVGSSAKPVDSPTSPDPGPLEIRVPWPERFALAASILGGPVESIGPGSGNPDMKILAAPWKLGARYASRLEISGDVASAMFRAVSAVPDFRFALVKVWFEAEHVRHFEAEQGGPVCVPREPDPNGHDRVASDTASPCGPASASTSPPPSHTPAWSGKSMDTTSEPKGRSPPPSGSHPDSSTRDCPSTGSSPSIKTPNPWNSPMFDGCLIASREGPEPVAPEGNP
jgi:hypothetical protein